MSKKKDANYHRFDKSERVAIEHCLKKGCSCRKIAHELGRSPSSISYEIATNRIISRGKNKGQKVEELPEDVCPKLLNFPHVCNGCKQWHYHCSRKFRCEYDSTLAQSHAEETKVSSRKGVDMDEGEFDRLIGIIRGDLSRGLSPAQIVMSRKEQFKVSPSTIYRWIENGYANMTCMELRRRCKYKKRQHRVEVKPTAHGKSRAFAAFSSLDSEIRDGACEMDTVIGRARDSQCLLTLYLKPFKFQLALLLPNKTSKAVINELDTLEAVLGKDSFSQLFGIIVTDNGSEFADYERLEKSTLSQSEKRCSIYYCDVRQSQQKGSCEKNHVELRKILPKNRGISFDRLSRKDCAVLMSHLNSEPRQSLGGLCAIDMLIAAHGDCARKLLEAYGIEKIPFENLIMSPKAIGIARRQRHEEPFMI